MSDNPGIRLRQSLTLEREDPLGGEVVDSTNATIPRKGRREKKAAFSRNEHREKEAAAPQNERRDKTQPTRVIRPGIGPILECAVAASSATLFLAWSGTIDVNPLDRIGQVSGLAQLQFAFGGVGMLLIGAVLLAAWTDKGTALAMTHRIICAAMAGLSTGLVAGGLSVALHGTPSPLFVGRGDTGRIVEWASSLLSGGSMPKGYPPLAIHLLAKWARLSGQPVAYAYKDFQLVGLALFGPMAYCAWRMLLPPFWAIAIGITTALPLIDPYKPYTNIILVVLIPLLGKLLLTLRAVPAQPHARLIGTGALFGIGFGLLFVTYPGWYLWSAPGAALALAFSLPWRDGKVRAFVFLGTTMFTFLLVASSTLVDMVAVASKDAYFYFDVYVEPTYIAMWRGDFAGNPGVWPPHGELGGVGLFTVLLALGLGLALTLGLPHNRNRTLVVLIAGCLAGSWLIRFRLAGAMYATQTVQLYPRTTFEIVHCLLLLTGLGIYFSVTNVQKIIVKWRPLIADSKQSGPMYAAEEERGSAIAAAAPQVGMLCTLLLLFASSGASIADQYMPRNDGSTRAWAWVAQTTRTAEGRCPTYAPEGTCK